MNENPNSARPRDIDVRPQTGIVRSPLDEIKAIQTLLVDVYKDAGDGRTLFRELVQNADDAGAGRLRFTVLEHGWPHADNSLLRGPALLVANDGPFSDKDREALHKAIGGSKEEDVHKIGMFGIGLKSVFHICEAFLYIGAAQSMWQAGVLNPWAGAGGDPLHPNWDTVGDRDKELLWGAVTDLLGETDNGLLLWIPLRRAEHLDRGADGHPYGLGLHCRGSEELCSWFGRSTPAVLLLAQCRHLQTIDTKRAARPEGLGNSEELMCVERQAVEWLKRYRDDSPQPSDHEFEGTIATRESNASKGSEWFVVGIESFGGQGLHDLRSDPNWPQSSDWRNGRYALVPRKALAHAAVTVLRPTDGDTGQLGTRLRWAVFLPLNDDPAPSSSAIVESDGPSPAWEIILHGYFWPSQDRKSIPGVTDENGDATSDGTMRNRWNRTLCEELLLPLLPRALAKAVEGIDERVAQGLLERVVRSDMVKNRMPYVTQRHWLLPIVAPNRMHWRKVDADACQVLSIPKWHQAPEAVRNHFGVSCREHTDGVVFIDDAAPRFAGELDDWTIDHLECLLNSIPDDAFASKQSLQWIAEVVRHVLGLDACPEDIRATTLVQWLVERIAGDALAHTIRRSTPQKAHDELRDAWRGLCAAIPKAWLVETPVNTLQAVVELTECDGVIGEGLFLLPVGRRQGDSRPSLNLDKDRLDCALAALGQRLEEGGESERLRRSRLVLAETLLSVRPDCPMDDRLHGLPFLQAIRLPDDKEEAWSIADLRRRVKKHRVFASPVSEDLGYDNTNGTQLKRISDPKPAVRDLAMALGETVWLVNGDIVASVAVDVPSPVPEALALAVLQAETFAEATSRTSLLRRLESSILEDANVRFAARALLAGRVVEDGTELLQVHAGPERALLILLRLLDRPWCALDRQLAGSFSQDILGALSIGQTDPETLHRLLGECLDRPVDWKRLTEAEALHLLKHLHSTELEAQQRWCQMPLHQDIDGNRGVLDDHAWRSTKKTSDIVLPKELRAGLCLLDPDSDVAHLYYIVPELDRNGVLQLLLEDSRPWRFAKRIVQYVRLDGGLVNLPRGLRQQLKASRWLPDRDGGGLAPDAVLIAPEQVLVAVADLAANCAFGDKRFPNAIDPQIWPTAEPVVREVLGHMSRGRQIGRMVDALDSDRVAQVDGGAWLVMPESRLVDASLIDNALKTTLVEHHQDGQDGWKLLHTVNRILRYGDSQSKDDPKQLLLKLAEALCAPVPPERQIKMLKLLASGKPAKDSPSGDMFRRLLGCFAEINGFFEHVLPKLDLPTQDGNWHSSRDIARTETGVARRHLLVSELRPSLRLNGEDRLPPPMRVGYDSNKSRGDKLRPYFKPWCNRLPSRAVGAFLSLLGSGSRGEIAKLAEEWLGEDVSIKDMRSKLVDPNEEDPCAKVRVWVVPSNTRGNRVSAVNVIGERMNMEAEPNTGTLFAVDPVDTKLGITLSEPFWEIQLRDIDLQKHTRSQLLCLLGGTVERWATKYLKLDRERVNVWWSQWAESSKADLHPVLAKIEAHLPLTLHELDVRDNEILWDALKAVGQAQGKPEQALSNQTERDSLDRLIDLIHDPEHQKFLWRRVNELMRRYGYRNDSVLLELAQNADDALAQAAEIKGRPVPRSARRFLVRVHENGGKATLDVMHWGRPINDTGGATFLAGRNRQWDQDLYFMMLMNLSGKPGEVPGEALQSSTTGRFGLGFKSVHLLSPSPSVVSGFIAFSIAGGLLPLEQDVPDSADSWMIEGHRGTRIRLPLRRDVEVDEMIQSLFDRFSYARALLPVFARQVQEVVVKGGPFPGKHVFEGKPIGTSAWSIGNETELPNHDGPWRILRFRPADSGLKDMGTTALALGLRDGIPTTFARDVPFLWNVTPTSEEWACGYVVNGPFKLDPGRTHVSLDDDATLQAVRGLGDELGKGLIELHDVLTGAEEAEHCLMLGSDSQNFLSSLWEVLASGTDYPDKLRQRFLHCLHGNGHGLSAWMAARSIVPTRLPAPFPPRLSHLSSETSWEVATDGLEDPTLCAALAEIDDEDFRSLVDSRRIVSCEINRLLVSLCADSDSIRPVAVRPTNLLAELAKKWDYFLTPIRLHTLRPLSQDEVWNLVSNDPDGATWRGRLQAQSTAGSFQPLQRLLVQADSPLRDELDEDLRDEFLRSAFAPNDRILDLAYIGCREDWSVFLWLRGKHSVNANEIADWYRNVREDLRPAALRYLVYGRLQERVLWRLISLEACPLWLQDYDSVCQMLEGICEEHWRRRRLLSTLFPDRFVPEPLRQQVQIHSDIFFNRFSEWWNDDIERTKVITVYEGLAWPEWLRQEGDIAGSLQSESEDHWLALLVLGACQSLGRLQDDHHRGFLEWVHSQGWWDVFQAPEDSGAWMGMLREWQDGASAKMPYRRWMSLIPEIYQLSRYRDVYVRLLKSAGQRPDNMYNVEHLLAPRGDAALTGAGTRFDAPPAPLHMGLHWVLRELVRLKVIEGIHLYQDCWVPSEQVIRFLCDLGFDHPDDNISNKKKAHAIFDFLKCKLETATPNLHRAFDIPIRHVVSNQKLRRKLGLVQ